jgi:hypothetical protein
VAKRTNGSEKNRKEPQSGVARRLWAFSGNECAWGDPHCSTRLVTKEGAWIGKIAHIIGAEPGSTRTRHGTARTSNSCGTSTT